MLEANQQKTSSMYAFKLCVLGDGGVGKTTLVERLATGHFNPVTKMTIGIDFSLIHLDLLIDQFNTVPVDVTVWDLGGEDRFRFMLPAYMQGADGGVLLYDVTRFQSAMHLPDWIKMWRENVPPDTPIFLVGSKFDLVKEGMYPTVENNIRALKQELGIKIHFLISTKDGIMIDDLIQTITRDMYFYKNKQKATQPTSTLGYTLRT